MRYFAALLVFCFLAAATVPADAGSRNHGHGGGGRGEVIVRHGHPHGPMGRGHGARFHRLKPLPGIVHAIRRHHPGRLSDVRGPWPGPNGEPHYRVKWLTPEGRVLWLDVDASTGEVLDILGERERPPRRNR